MISQSVHPEPGKIFIAILIAVCCCIEAKSQSVIRINQLGYTLASSKVAVLGCIKDEPAANFELVRLPENKVVYSAVPKKFGAYGPFQYTARLDFSAVRDAGKYFIRAGAVTSPQFVISDTAYKGTADFTLRYMRQQRSGFNPFLNDSCHTHDGYTMYGPMKDSTLIDAAGGWHDASDYLQYVTTSANATYHLLAAWRDFPNVFSDNYSANGLAGANKTADVLDEAKWGLDWLLKMHPRKDWMFNQLADDRDHIAMRLPNRDSVDYGFGKGGARPVYFATGEPQGLGKYKNASTGVASTAGKFAYAFALGSSLFKKSSIEFSKLLATRAVSAYNLGLAKPGICQTAPNRAPYFYDETNWTDDMELGAAALYQSTGEKKYELFAKRFSDSEKITPWLGADTMRHYQFYPFHNFGHYELAKATTAERSKLIRYYKEGINRVWQKAKQNGFYRGVPFIWCSNNLTVSFAIQCQLYRRLSGDDSYVELEQACIDWIFGCNPWGTSMVYGLPSKGDYPAHPHSSLSETYKYPLDGGLVDGPVYGSIFNSLRGITLYGKDEYADYQSDLAVYHDDAGDYSTNEPTMDGTASLVYLLGGIEAESGARFTKEYGAITRGDISKKQVALVFTGDEFADGAKDIMNTLQAQKVKASFFLTGNFYRTKAFAPIISQLAKAKHYLGSHSSRHLLYADWKKRDSLLVTREQFNRDMEESFLSMKKLGITKQSASIFLPPYEWYNDSIAAWSTSSGLQLVNFTPGTRSNADYTWPELPGYRSSDEIYKSITEYAGKDPNGLNGFILLLHIGTDPRRKDKFYTHLSSLLTTLTKQGYTFVRIDEMLR